MDFHEELLRLSNWKPTGTVESFKYITKDKGTPKRRQRVYFTCHPDDFEKYFQKICDDIFKSQDCVIYYTDDMNEDYSETIWNTDLHEMNLFVVPITMKLLCGGNRALDIDIPFIKENKYYFLPIMMENGLYELFTAKIGKYEYLKANYSSNYINDIDNLAETEIPYEEKLKKYLDSVLISYELKKEIQDAFDAYIFLSYRKKDRQYANQLMKMIHENSMFRDIAIWYDEFLTPGEVFEDEIREALNKSELFTLLVTKNLLENPNYVLTKEYPEAKANNKNIMPVEMDETNRIILEQLYDSIPECVPGESKELIYTQISEFLNGIMLLENDTNPEHNFLIGLAYLNGIDVEKNIDRAVELITEAAEQGILEAIEKLEEMYHDGIGVKRDWQKWVEWLEKDLEICKQKKYNSLLKYKTFDLACGYLELGNSQKALELFQVLIDLLHSKQEEDSIETQIVMNNMALALGKMGEYARELEIEKYLYEIREKTLGKDDSQTLTTLNNMAITYFNMGEYSVGWDIINQVYESRKRTLGEDNPKTLNTKHIMCEYYIKKGMYSDALQLEMQVYEARKRIIGEEHPDTLISHENIASIYTDLKDYKNAIKIEKDVYEIQKKVLGEEHPYTLATLNNMCVIYCYLENNTKQMELQKHVCEVCKRVFGEEHPNTLTTLNNLSSVYFKLGEYYKAFEIEKPVYEARKRILGEQHPDTLYSFDYLELIKDRIEKGVKKIENLKQDVLIYAKIGNQRKELETVQLLFTMQKQVLGEEHKDSISSGLSLALLYSELGEYVKAIEVNLQVYEIQKRVLGEENSDTLTTIHNISASLYLMGEYTKALELEKHVYEIRKKVWGEEDPDTLLTLNNMAIYYGDLGDYNKELEIETYLYEIQEKKLGEEHPDTLFALNNLAVTFIKMEDYDKALEIEQRVYTLRKKVLGKEHIDTIVTLYNIGIIYEKSKEYIKAIKIMEIVYELQKKVMGENNPSTRECLEYINDLKKRV